jgi:hypothetical protein
MAYLQNTHKYSVSVPTAFGGSVEVPSIKFINDSDSGFYDTYVIANVLTLYTEGTPPTEDIVYTYVSTPSGGGGTPGGEDGEVQFNNDGELGGIPSVGWDGEELYIDDPGGTRCSTSPTHTYISSTDETTLDGAQVRVQLEPTYSKAQLLTSNSGTGGYANILSTSEGEADAETLLLETKSSTATNLVASLQLSSGKIQMSGKVGILNIPVAANDAAASTLGLEVGSLYRTAAGELRILVTSFS